MESPTSCAAGWLATQTLTKIEQYKRLTANAAKPRFKTQTKLHDPANGVEGNCTQAAIASLLGLELDEVPDFNDRCKNDPDAGRYWFELDRWFAARGWQFQMWSKDAVINGIHLADGKTVRGTSHFVVMDGQEIIHDPHPSRVGLIEISHRYALLPLDPAAFRYEEPPLHKGETVYFLGGSQALHVDGDEDPKAVLVSWRSTTGVLTQVVVPRSALTRHQDPRLGQ